MGAPEGVIQKEGRRSSEAQEGVNFRLVDLAARAEHDQPYWEGDRVFSSGINGRLLS